MNIKEQSAKCAFDKIIDGQTIGLGGGQTIKYIVSMLAKSNKNVTIVSPSIETTLLCTQSGLRVVPTYTVDHVNLAFDGCDEVDKNLCALKSGGAIHTKEKIIAKMADEYILCVDDSKFFDTLPFIHPVTLEVLFDAFSYVCSQFVSIKPRDVEKKDGWMISDYGNVILDVDAKGASVEEIYHKINDTVGIVDSSLFVDCVSSVIVASSSGIKEVFKDGKVVELDG